MMEPFEFKYREILEIWLTKQGLSVVRAGWCEETVERLCCYECQVDVVQINYRDAAGDIQTHTFYGTLIDLVNTLNRFAKQVSYRFPKKETTREPGAEVLSGLSDPWD